MSAVEPREATGFKEYDLDGLFAPQTLSDMAHKAALNTRARFDSKFPGWQLYRRIVAGVDLFDRELEAWAVWMARGVARAEKLNGRHVIGQQVRMRPDWIAQAGRDGLDYVIFRKYAEGLNKRSERLGVDSETYQKVRDAVSGGMVIGLNTFRSQLHAEYMRILFLAKTDKAKFDDISVGQISEMKISCPASTVISGSIKARQARPGQDPIHE